MKIKDLLIQLENATHPVAKALFNGEHTKVLAIGFKKGMLLKEHKTQLPAILTVLEGAMLYREGNQEIRLSTYDEVQIPVHLLHSVEALSDGLCLLIQG